MRVRYANDGDREAIAKLIQQLGETPSVTAPQDVDLDRWWNTLDLVLESSEWVILLGEEAGEAIGLLIMVIVPNLYDGWPRAEITELIVKEGHRRQGRGAELVARAESEARQRGCSEFEVSTEKENVVATEFYRKCRFQKEHLLFEKHL